MWCWCQHPEGRDFSGRSGSDAGLRGGEVEGWREKFLLGVESALLSHLRDEEALKDEQIKKPNQKIGDLVLDNDILWEVLKPYPSDRKTFDAWEPACGVSIR